MTLLVLQLRKRCVAAGMCAAYLTARPEASWEFCPLVDWPKVGRAIPTCGGSLRA